MPPTTIVPGDPYPTVSGGQAFPVGSVFISVVSTDPATLLGYGTWASFGAGRVLVGLDGTDTDFNTVEKIGGAKTVQSTGAVSTPTFTGTASQATSSVSAGTPAGTVSTPTFTGTLGTTAAANTGASAIGTTSSTATLKAHTHTFTPAGTISTPTFTGSAFGTHSHTITPSGTNSAPTFTGDATSVVQPYIVTYFWKRTA